MQVCFITPYSPKEVTGVSKFVDDLSRTLADLNIDSFAITKLAEPSVQTSTQLVEINCDVIPRFKDIYFSIQTATEIFKSRKNIDLLHLQTPLPQSACSAMVGKLLKIPVITTVHGRFPSPNSFFKRMIYDLFESLTFIFSDSLVFVSSDAKDYFSSANGTVILNGIDISRVHFDKEIREKKRIELGIGNEFVFIYVGRWVGHKGIYDLVEAFGKITSEFNNTKLLFIGTGEAEALKAKIRELNVCDNVLLLGRVDNVQEYFCVADSFILFTSSLEGLPLALLEAMACRVVPIATNVSGIPEVVINGNNGYLIEQGNQTQLIERMSWCITNIEKVHLIGENSERTIINSHSVEKMADEYIQIYKKHVKFHN
ncbi:glycosyltransferase family 4 protein [Methanolobus sp. WCC4]|uniref:glycosyltransferase family 4 protein n=1 Tax=Methanolobus sp. WCC4 TaxID=3125784 RepID=UPI0030F9C79C